MSDEEMTFFDPEDDDDHALCTHSHNPNCELVRLAAGIASLAENQRLVAHSLLQRISALELHLRESQAPPIVAGRVSSTSTVGPNDCISSFAKMAQAGVLSPSCADMLVQWLGTGFPTTLQMYAIPASKKHTQKDLLLCSADIDETLGVWLPLVLFWRPTISSPHRARAVVVTPNETRAREIYHRIASVVQSYNMGVTVTDAESDIRIIPLDEALRTCSISRSSLVTPSSELSFLILDSCHCYIESDFNDLSAYLRSPRVRVIACCASDPDGVHKRASAVLRDSPTIIATAPEDDDDDTLRCVSPISLHPSNGRTTCWYSVRSPPDFSERLKSLSLIVNEMHSARSARLIAACLEPSTVTKSHAHLICRGTLGDWCTVRSFSSRSCVADVDTIVHLTALQGPDMRTFLLLTTEAFVRKFVFEVPFDVVLFVNCSPQSRAGLPHGANALLFEE